MNLRSIFLLAGLTLIFQLRPEESRAIQHVQPLAPSRLAQDKLAIGPVELRLGMPQDEVIGKLTSAGFTVKSSNGFLVWDMKRGGVNVLMGAVDFTSGKLSFINREWMLDDNPDAASIAEAIYGALSSAHNEGRDWCSLNTNMRQNPTAEVKTVILACVPGQRYLTITAARIQGQRETANVEEILRVP